MSRICSICDKSPKVGNLVSHANNKTKRWVYPNTHKMRYIKVDETHKKRVPVHYDSVCTKCVKAGKIQKVF
jgi:large subunit ribosomal protein L28